MFGMIRVATALPPLHLANPNKNAKEILKLLKDANTQDIAIVLFPELTLIGYTLSDLLYQSQLLTAQNKALSWLLQNTKELPLLYTIGVVIKQANRLYNCAVVIREGKILGIVPKSYIPNKREFYEKRHFNSGASITQTSIKFLGELIPFGVDILFSDDNELVIGVELCEDLWALTPPSNQMASNGANLILNLSASNELVGKANYRTELVRTQSARLVSAYAYASSGVGESSTDTLFGGDAIIAEYGSIVARSERFSYKSQLISADIDLDKLNGLRLAEGNYSDAPQTPYRLISIGSLPRQKDIKRYIDPHPFVPSNPKERQAHCEEITAIQAHALIRRINHANIKRAIIGISGGLDSTLALLATWRAFNISKRKSSDILAITMPGFGTTSRTLNNAKSLCKALGVELREIPIDKLAILEFSAIGHDSNIHDITYENVQARARTEILMNLANKEGGLVIGTGDLSEIALGFSTYNGDHMSMYALNSGIPKTLIRYIVSYYADNFPNLSEVLNDILDTPISPELLPIDDDKIVQKSEDIIGPYELHDFFLYHFIKYGAKPSKILALGSIAFKDRYDSSTIKKWLILFLRRFFTQQFKRSCMPDGPKVGTINLSPRADWRMPSDAEFESWIEELGD